MLEFTTYILTYIVVKGNVETSLKYDFTNKINQALCKIRKSTPSVQNDLRIHNTTMHPPPLNNVFIIIRSLIITSLSCSLIYFCTAALFDLRSPAAFISLSGVFYVNYLNLKFFPQHSQWLSKIKKTKIFSPPFSLCYETVRYRPLLP